MKPLSCPTIFFLLTAPAGFAQTITAVTNGASFVADNVSPGGLATIFGANLSTTIAQAQGSSFPTVLAGTSVNVNGIAAPLYYVSPAQIDFQMPQQLLAGQPTRFVHANVISQGRGGNQFGFTISSTSPGIFVQPSGQAIVQNADHSLNGPDNSAAVGSLVTVYLTGIGAVDNPAGNGAPAPASQLANATAPASATIGGLNAKVSFLGLTPGFVGLAQANIEIPAISSGTYPLMITVGRSVSNGPMVTVVGAPSNSQHNLTALVGALGSPALSSSSYTAGSTVPYSYAAQNGFSSAVVELDGPAVPPNGSIVMNADHWLWAFGQPVTGSDFQGYITAPNNPLSIPYPQFYMNRSSSFTARVTDLYCALNSKIVAYPRTYLGSFPMPAITGAPLPNSIARGVNLKDFWFSPNGAGVANPSLNTGCFSSGTMDDAFAASVARAKLLGAGHVEFINSSELRRERVVRP